VFEAQVDSFASVSCDGPSNGESSKQVAADKQLMPSQARFDVDHSNRDMSLSYRGISMAIGAV
jgi:hypothetical protein